jgi:hypothetical protein
MIEELNSVCEREEGGERKEREVKKAEERVMMGMWRR